MGITLGMKMLMLYNDRTRWVLRFGHEDARAEQPWNSTGFDDSGSGCVVLVPNLSLLWGGISRGTCTMRMHEDDSDETEAVEAVSPQPVDVFDVFGPHSRTFRTL